MRGDAGGTPASTARYEAESAVLAGTVGIYSDEPPWVWRDSGVVSDDEFAVQKAKFLA